MKRLQNRKALVTGANSGIGRAIAIRLAQEGASVAINYVKDSDAADEVVSQINNSEGKAIAIKADISSEEQVDSMFDQAAKEFGGLDILVNNAGMESYHPFLEMPLDAWRKVIDIDLTGAFLCAQRAARIIVNSGAGGSIVNITSVHQVIPWGGYSHYCAAKAALEMLTKTVAQELAEKNVRINSVAPGAIATPINQNVWGDPEGLKDLLTKIPANRLGKPEEIASAVVFLCSDEASYVNGTTLFVDGGMTLYSSFSHGG
jgi:glucose 1-dehydrogenase